MRAGWTIAAGLIALGLAPMIGRDAALRIADWAGCNLFRGPNSCMIAGVDWGGALHRLFEGGWWWFLTAPMALAGALLAGAMALAALWRLGQR